MNLWNTYIEYHTQWHLKHSILKQRALQCCSGVYDAFAADVTWHFYPRTCRRGMRVESRATLALWNVGQRLFKISAFDLTHLSISQGTHRKTWTAGICKGGSWDIPLPHIWVVNFENCAFVIVALWNSHIECIECFKLLTTKDTTLIIKCISSVCRLSEFKWETAFVQRTLLDSKSTEKSSHLQKPPPRKNNSGKSATAKDCKRVGVCFD